MIRINLLGTSKSKGKHGGAATAAGLEVGDVGSPKMKILVVLVLAALLNLGYWYKLDRQKQEVAAKMQVAEQKNRDLADVKARYLERQREAQSGRD